MNYDTEILKSELSNMQENEKMVYISGQITGIELEHAKRNFHEAFCALEQEGLVPINPMELVPYSPELTWADYMVKDIEALLKCDAIYMLNNWGKSKGARVERAIAMELGLEIIYQK